MELDQETKRIYNLMCGILGIIIAGIVIFVCHEIVSYKLSKEQPEAVMEPIDVRQETTLEKHLKNQMEQAEKVWTKNQYPSQKEKRMGELQHQTK